MTSSALAPGTVSAVTGAASGIGRALALALGRGGVRLALADVDGDALERVVSEIRAGGGTVEGRVVDVTRAPEVGAWASVTADRFGGVAAVWAVAGIIHAGEVLDAPVEDLAAVVDVDFWGVRAGRPRVLVGADARVADLLARLTGTGYERLVGVTARRGDARPRLGRGPGLDPVQPPR
jgi:NADP-dependent 3-hydroxy acid dehydrogenase YdfG